MAKFSKQHYQVIAQILAAHVTRAASNSPGPHIAVLANDLADLFGRDNSRFNREHFLAVVRGERPVNSRPPRS